MQLLVAREDGGARHADDVVDVDHLGRDMAEGGQAYHHFLSRCWRAEKTQGEKNCKRKYL